MRQSISIILCTQFQIKSHSLDKSVHIKNLNHQLVNADHFCVSVENEIYHFRYEYFFFKSVSQ